MLRRIRSNRGGSSIACAVSASWNPSTSSAMPSLVVTMCASTMLARLTASAPAISRNSPGWSAV
jgi:hypothetical protein